MNAPIYAKWIILLCTLSVAVLASDGTYGISLTEFVSFNSCDTLAFSVTLDLSYPCSLMTNYSCESCYGNPEGTGPKSLKVQIEPYPNITEAKYFPITGSIQEVTFDGKWCMDHPERRMEVSGFAISKRSSDMSYVTPEVTLATLIRNGGKTVFRLTVTNLDTNNVYASQTMYEVRGNSYNTQCFFQDVDESGNYKNELSFVIGETIRMPVKLHEFIRKLSEDPTQICVEIMTAYTYGEDFSQSLYHRFESQELTGEGFHYFRTDETQARFERGAFHSGVGETYIDLYSKKSYNARDYEGPLKPTYFRVYAAESTEPMVDTNNVHVLATMYVPFRTYLPPRALGLELRFDDGSDSSIIREHGHFDYETGTLYLNDWKSRFTLWNPNTYPNPNELYQGYEVLGSELTFSCDGHKDIKELSDVFVIGGGAFDNTNSLDRCDEFNNYCKQTYDLRNEFEGKKMTCHLGVKLNNKYNNFYEGTPYYDNQKDIDIPKSVTIKINSASAAAVASVDSNSTNSASGAQIHQEKMSFMTVLGLGLIGAVGGFIGSTHYLFS